MKYSLPSKNNGRLKSIEIYEGESIETKCARILQDKEPITDTAPIIYTAKEDGVLPAYNIRRRKKFGVLVALNQVKNCLKVGQQFSQNITRNMVLNSILLQCN